MCECENNEMSKNVEENILFLADFFSAFGSSLLLPIKATITGKAYRAIGGLSPPTLRFLPGGMQGVALRGDRPVSGLSLGRFGRSILPIYFT